jgi:hypothetical protein
MIVDDEDLHGTALGAIGWHDKVTERSLGRMQMKPRGPLRRRKLTAPFHAISAENSFTGPLAAPGRDRLLRSGSTLLAALLRQDPAICAGIWIVGG